MTVETVDGPFPSPYHVLHEYDIASYPYKASYSFATLDEATNWARQRVLENGGTALITNIVRIVGR